MELNVKIKITPEEIKDLFNFLDCDCKEKANHSDISGTDTDNGISKEINDKDCFNDDTKQAIIEAIPSYLKKIESAITETKEDASNCQNDTEDDISCKSEVIADLSRDIKESGHASCSRDVEPNIYHETFNPEDWKKAADDWECKREVYIPNKAKVKESSLLTLEIDEDKMFEGVQKGTDEWEKIDRFIDDIINNRRLAVYANNMNCQFIFTGPCPKPIHKICIVLTELPFPDTPASSLGLDK